MKHTLPKLKLPKKKKELFSSSKFSKPNLLIFAFIFAAVGGYFIYSSFASGFAASTEPENGTITSPATQITDATASGGKAVRFGMVSTSSCALPNYPDASCTGVPAGTTLTTVNGDVTINTPGITYQNKLVNGQIIVNAANVTIRNVKVVLPSGPNQTGVVSGSTGLLVEDTEINCSMAGGHTAISSENYTALRVNAYGCDNTMWAEHNVTIQDSYLHDNICYNEATDPHTDGVQSPAGATNVTIIHNRIYGNYAMCDEDGNGTLEQSFGNSAITTGRAREGGATNFLIQDNILAGGGYTVYCVEGGSGNNFRIINNHFTNALVQSIGGYGPWTECSDETQVSGNVYNEDGCFPNPGGGPCTSYHAGQLLPGQ